MTTEKIDKIQGNLEKAVWKWWFYLVFVLIQFLPTYAAKGFDPRDMGEVISTVLSNAVITSLDIVYPLFKLIPMLLIVLIIFRKKGVGRWFNLYAGLSYLLFAVLQHIAVTEEYGFSIVTSNLVMLLVVAAFWFWDAAAQKNEFVPIPQPKWRYWVIPLALIAFWYPLNPATLLPDFNPIYLITNGAGLAFCMMTPVYLAILYLHYPKINLATMRATGLAGIIIAFFNILMNFIMFPESMWWNGVLHLPLLMISGAALGQKKPS